jgi:tRNA (uracil-5-)-methyltransferase
MRRFILGHSPMLLTKTQPENYQEHFANKVESFKKQLLEAGLSITELATFPSPNCFYRLRAEFKCWHTGNTANYAMTDPATKETVIIDNFDIASKAINELMPKLLEKINSNELLRKKCFQIEFLSTLSEDMLVTLIYHKALGDEWLEAAKQLKTDLAIEIIGRSRKQKVVFDRDFVNETLIVNDKAFHYKQIEGSFTQPNGEVCQKMLSWAVDNSFHLNNRHLNNRHLNNDLLELYCGNANFTLPLSQNFNRVLATEISKTSVNAAQDNIHKNDISNVKILRMSSEEFTQAMNKERTFRRVQDAGIDLDDYQFSTVFVDPPRAGLDEDTVSMVQRFENIIYISCNTNTLIENLKTLSKTHKIQSLAAFDQFPYTDHLESGVILTKR